MLLLAGWGLDKIFDWLGDPANEKAIKEFSEFLTVAVPAIVKGLLAVIGIGLFTKLALFTKSIVMGAVKLISGLWAFMGKLATWAMANPKMALAVGLGGLIGGLAVLGSRQKEDDTAEALIPPDDDVKPPTGKEGPPDAPVLNQFAGGGQAQGTDTDPAMLTPGEYVMSKGAVNQ